MSCRAEEAVSLFKRGLLCSQAILAVFGPQYGLNENDCLRISRGFGSGMARQCEACGAVTGAFMVIGLKYQGKGKQAKEDTYALMQEFAHRFQETHKSINCQELLKCDLSTQDGQRYFQDNGLMMSCCAQYVKSAAQILEELL